MGVHDEFVPLSFLSTKNLVWTSHDCLYSNGFYWNLSNGKKKKKKWRFMEIFLTEIHPSKAVFWCTFFGEIFLKFPKKRQRLVAVLLNCSNFLRYLWSLARAWSVLTFLILKLVSSNSQFCKKKPVEIPPTIAPILSKSFVPHPCHIWRI